MRIFCVRYIDRNWDVWVRLPSSEGNPVDPRDENSVTIVPIGIDVPPLKLKGPKGPEIRVDFEKLSLSVGE